LIRAFKDKEEERNGTENEDPKQDILRGLYEEVLAAIRHAGIAAFVSACF
jgi:hypothetical protein